MVVVCTGYYTQYFVINYKSKNLKICICRASQVTQW